MDKQNGEQHKKYFLTVTEEAVLNPEYYGMRGGRVECYSKDDKYAVYEARFLVESSMYDDFMKFFDFREVDKLPYIRFDYKGDKIE